jgi:tetratricopeptide (TPR) repeat protein
MNAQRFAEAAAVLERLDASHPGELRVLSNLGVARARNGDFAGALAALDRALPLDTGTGFVQTNRAACLLAMERPREALVAADAAVRVAPRSPHAHFARGGVLLVLGERELGLAALREAARLDPNDAGIAAELRAQERVR